VLIVVTHRPEFDIATLGTDRLTSLMVDQLPATHGREMVRAVLGEGTDDETIAAIVERTDGNPLFIEELAPLALELGPGGHGDVPASLQASLVAQIDRLRGAKRCAQIAAVIGREFSLELLGGVLAEDQAADPLTALLESGIVHPSPFVPGEFVFKHALVRDAAYGTMLSSDRRTIHARIAEVMMATLSATTSPESLARHFAEAEQWYPAAQQFHAAGRRAIDTGGYQEARTHLRAALDAASQCDAGQQRDAIELQILLDLAPVVMTVDTYAAAAAREHYDRASELADHVGDQNQQFTARWGAYFVGEIQAEWKQAAINVDQLLQLDATGLRPDLPIQIHHAAATLAGGVGDITTLLHHDRAILAMYDRELHADHRFRFGGHDPGVCGHGQMALGLAWAGSPDEALDFARRCVDLAHDLDHPPTTALALWFNAWTLYEVDQAADALSATAEVMSFCEQHGARAIARSAEILRLATLVDRDAAFTVAHARLERMRHRDQRGFLVPVFAAWAAEAALDVGRVEEAMVAVDFGEHVANDSGEHAALGTLHHLRGRAFEAGGPRDVELALAEYGAAREICREQGRHWTGLLPAVSGARLLAKRGDRSQAVDVLTAALAPFPDDLQRPRVTRARELLADLA
jgi:tetratricopeptide (TPR) repeat protein